jgi:hypothetical protein
MWDIESPLSKKSARFFAKNAPKNESCSERVIKLSISPMTRSTMHCKPYPIVQGEFSKSIPEVSSNYSDQISSRILRIENSIANELSALDSSR